MVETEGKNILLDCGPDFRQQMIKHEIYRLDAVLISHEHYDHVGGLDDLRPFCTREGIDVYAEDNVADAIRERMPYAFRQHHFPGLPNLALHAIRNRPFVAAGVGVIPVRVMHGCLKIFGYRIHNMAYLTDMKSIPEKEFSKLEGLDILIIDALRKREHPTHESLGEALDNIARIRPKETYLIHLSHSMGLQADVEKELPPHVHPAYDGLSVTSDSNP
jgi:phosphoribosyl 1,2-cyclic phosphate phosphodiesterase